MTLRNRIIFVTTLALSACERPVAYDPGPVPPRHIVEKYVSHELGIDSFVKTYWPYEPNKAFAVSDDGVYGYSASRLSSPEFAERSALAYCEVHRTKGNFPSPCRVVNVNGRWVGRETALPSAGSQRTQ